MIVSFANDRTAALFHGGKSSALRRLPSDVQATALRKLDMLNAAHVLADLKAPPGNRLEPLHGNRRGFHSIRVNDQWRIVFRWTARGPERVELVDYHS